MIEFFRRRPLGPYVPAGAEQTDEAYQELLRAANARLDVAATPSLDVNSDSAVDGADILVIYYVLALPELVGDGSVFSGFEQYRRAFLSPYLNAGASGTDAEMRSMIDAVHNLQP